MEFFDPSGESFSVNSQVKIGGGWSRGWPQRTLHLNFAKDEVGNKQDAIVFDVFGDDVYTGDEKTILNTFSRFRLTNGGSNYDGANNSTCLNDVFVQQICRGMTNFTTTAYRPVTVFLNGEYWGYYAMREHYSDAYYSTNFHVKKSEVEYIDYTSRYILSDGDVDDWNAFYAEFSDYLNTQNFALDSVFDEFEAKYVDIDSFIDLVLVEAYADNWDFMQNGNNFRMWRVKTFDRNNPFYTDGRLRFSMHDADMVFSTNNPKINNRLAMTGSKYISSNGGYPNYLMFKKLLCNEKFRQRLYNRIEYIATVVFEESRVDAKLNELYSMIEPFITDMRSRWAWTMSMSTIKTRMDNLRSYLKNRYNWFRTTSADILGILPESEDDNEGTTFECNQYFEGNGSLNPHVEENPYGDFEMTYTLINNGINVYSSSYQYHVKFVYQNGSSTSNYVLRVLKNNTSVIWLTKVSDESAFEGHTTLNYGTHRYKIRKKGTTMTVWVDDIKCLERTVPAGDVTRIEFYQHTANCKYRNYHIEAI